MIVRVIDVFVKPDKVDEFRKASVKNHEGSIQEEGVVRFDLLQNASDPTHFLLYEVYTVEEASHAHKETAHYKEWKERVESMMAHPRKGNTFTVIAPSDRSKW